MEGEKQDNTSLSEQFQTLYKKKGEVIETTIATQNTYTTAHFPGLIDTSSDGASN